MIDNIKNTEIFIFSHKSCVLPSKPNNSFRGSQKKLMKMIFFTFLSLYFFSCTGEKEIPFELTETNRIVITAVVNGTKGRFFWDTGAAVSLADCNFKNLDFSHRESFVWSFFGSVLEEFDFYYLPEIIIGGVKLKTKTEIAKISEVLKVNILETESLDGVLGINVFAGYWCELSFSKNRIILHKEKPIKFDTFIPAVLYENKFRILIDVDEKASPFLIDTGDGEGIHFPPSVILGKTKNEYVKILLPRIKKTVPVNVQDIYLVKTNKILIFDNSFENKTIITDSPIRYDANMATTMGNISIEFLKNYDLLFDFTNLPFSTSGLYYKRINTEINEKRLFPLEGSQVDKILESGIYSFYRTPEGITLGIIKGSFLNTEYGITERTVITKIDGKPVKEISDNELWNIDIVKVKNFTILNNDEERTVEFSF